MNLRHLMTSPMRRLVAGLMLVSIASLAIGFTAGSVSASNTSRNSSDTASTAMPRSAVGPVAPGADTIVQAGAQGANVPTTTGAGAASAIYPIQGYNSLGVAPAGTIVAQGTGAADMKADGSDKAAALKKATDLALADAHGQAAAVAASMGVQLKTIYSVSTVTGQNYVYPTPDCAVPPVLPITPSLQGGTTSSGGTSVSSAGSPEICVPTKAVAPTAGQLVVTLIVAYTFA